MARPNDSTIASIGLNLLAISALVSIKAGL